MVLFYLNSGEPHFTNNEEPEMVHFCWRLRSAPADEGTLDLIMIPGDGTFLPYTGKETSASSENVTSPAGGRIFVLKFQSSSQRHLFWMQSKSQHPDGKPNWFSQRDLKIGQIVDMLLQGAEVDVQAEMDEVRENGEPPRRDDEDEDMEDAPPTSPRLRSNSTGGAGAGATGGDVREEGEEAREGGADGGRA
jgi:26S proteasome regulatory subunit N13